MLKTKIIHPELLCHLAKCGHKTKVLIADSNYSFVTNASPKANVVYLNFAPGMLPSTDVLAGVVDMLNIESAEMMAWPSDFDNTIVEQYQSYLPADTPMSFLERSDFYSAVKSDDTLLVIATGEQRRFANILLTVGAVF
ncbi:RbsD/FucU transporter [Vibrio sp. 10N.286.49.C2]|uniref:RbsD/FucU domain-containing protein n=1 Tax=unclassified Vibrio TaxID=2614977 RepID=UPI000C866FAC|nr:MULTISPECIES: RbsD/FucU domain-containing protein [unclassified Vibrio]PMH43387.1 RbsD/FucU transporter [Vibrio sp. 10N.286.49.C2]PMH57039.1 RbsD/FucU transporter [Vibrio sp. 10N.286.49.B1]PMH80317.1 RbsD/FucU transporter [Vibrio sp. 10N.286.48.B7]